MIRKKILLMVLVLLMVCSAACANTSAAETVWTTRLTAHCVTVEEGQQLMRSRTSFHAQINERSLPFSQFEEFYRTYPSVQEGTGMYYPPESRESLW